MPLPLLRLDGIYLRFLISNICPITLPASASGLPAGLLMNGSATCGVPDARPPVRQAIARLGVKCPRYAKAPPAIQPGAVTGAGTFVQEGILAS